MYYVLLLLTTYVHICYVSYTQLLCLTYSMQWKLPLQWKERRIFGVIHCKIWESFTDISTSTLILDIWILCLISIAVQGICSSHYVCIKGYWKKDKYTCFLSPTGILTLNRLNIEILSHKEASWQSCLHWPKCCLITFYPLHLFLNCL